MTCERLRLNTDRSTVSNRFVLKFLGPGFLLLAFHLPGLVLRESGVAARALVDALAGLSESDLKQEHDFV
jgi:hypothetical protein